MRGEMLMGYVSTATESSRLQCLPVVLFFASSPQATFFLEIYTHPIERTQPDFKSDYNYTVIVHSHVPVKF